METAAQSNQSVRFFDRSDKRDVVLCYKEAAVFLGLSLRHLHRLVAKKTIPHRKCGRYVRFFRSELIAWLDRQKGVKLR